MQAWAVWLAAAVCAALGVVWFRRAHRILCARRSMLESAKTQLAACRERAVGVRYDPGLAEVLQRSESIYRQALDLYNAALHKPWVYLPGRLMGFAPETEESLS